MFNTQTLYNQKLHNIHNSLPFPPLVHPDHLPLLPTFFPPFTFSSPFQIFSPLSLFNLLYSSHPPLDTPHLLHPSHPPLNTLHLLHSFHPSLDTPHLLHSFHPPSRSFLPPLPVTSLSTTSHPTSNLCHSHSPINQSINKRNDSFASFSPTLMSSVIRASFFMTS